MKSPDGNGVRAVADNLVTVWEAEGWTITDDPPIEKKIIGLMNAADDEKEN
jgi:hypothetical protein